MTTLIPAINHTHIYFSLMTILKKTLAPILHDVELVNYEATRITNGLMYLAEWSPQFDLETIAHEWITVLPTVSAMLFDCKKTVVAITRDFCIVIGQIHEDKLIVDNAHIFNTAGVPTAYVLPFDVLLVKVII